MTLGAAYTLSEQLEIIGSSVGGILPELILTGTFLLAIIIEISLGKRNRKLVPATVFIGVMPRAIRKFSPGPRKLQSYGRGTLRPCKMRAH